MERIPYLHVSYPDKRSEEDEEDYSEVPVVKVISVLFSDMLENDESEILSSEDNEREQETVLCQDNTNICRPLSSLSPGLVPDFSEGSTNFEFSLNEELNGVIGEGK